MTTSDMVDSAPSPNEHRPRSMFTYAALPDVDAVRAFIQGCEGVHVQQVAYSTFMDALTQVCFTEQVIRSTIAWDGSKSWAATDA